MEQTGLTFDPFLPPWFLFVLAAVLVALSVLAYRRTTRPVSRRMKLLLLGLRIGAVAVPLICLLRPSVETVHYEISRRSLLLLVDHSDSMAQITDTASGASRLEAVRRLLEEHRADLERLRESYEVVELPFAQGLLPERGGGETRYSAYGLALEQAFNEVAGGQTDGVVVFGDGSHNYGPPDPIDAAARLADHGVPVHTVGVGQDVATAQLRDVKVLDVTSPRSVFLFSPFRVQARLLCRGCEGREVTATLRFAGQPPRRRQVTVSHSEEMVPLEFEVIPDARGDFKLTVEAEPVEDELLETNNAASTFVKVVSEGLAVGYFDTLRPESKFLAGALSGDRHLRVRRTIVLPGQKVPESAMAMDNYEVVILGDLQPRAILPSRVLELKRRVQDEGKGLIILPGPTGWGANGWQTTTLGDLLPVRASGGVRRSSGAREVRVEQGNEGHPAVALADEAEATRRRWAELPPLTAVFTGARPKRAATVLLRDEEGNPVVVAQRSGAGRVACVLSDTTFRWFFTERDTQELHRLFWRQLALWASGRAEAPRARVRLELSRDRVLIQETITLRTRVTGPEEQPMRDANVALTVTDPEGTTAEVPVTFSRAEGAHVGEYVARTAGDHSAKVEVRRDGTALGTDQALFHASSETPELEDPVANLKLLRRLSAVTRDSGGSYFSYLRADELFSTLKRAGEPLKLTTRRRRDIWDTWPFFAIFAALLATEWGLRKWKGLT